MSMNVNTSTAVTDKNSFKTSNAQKVKIVTSFNSLPTVTSYITILKNRKNCPPFLFVFRSCYFKMTLSRNFIQNWSKYLYPIPEM